MKKIEISSNKSFGIVFFTFFLIIALWPLINDGNIRIWSLAVSIIFLILGITNAKILTPLNNLWFKFGLFLGKIVSPLVMGAIFFLVVTPTGIIMRLMRKDLLNLKKNNSKTYWLEKKNENNSMKNQF
tara:strand:- start:47 stop:430 length:384 start_codon:yes stop_codon:yes gene_type:complete